MPSMKRKRAPANSGKKSTTSSKKAKVTSSNTPEAPPRATRQKSKARKASVEQRSDAQAAGPSEAAIDSAVQDDGIVDPTASHEPVQDNGEEDIPPAPMSSVGLATHLVGPSHADQENSELSGAHGGDMARFEADVEPLTQGPTESMTPAVKPASAILQDVNPAPAVGADAPEAVAELPAPQKDSTVDGPEITAADAQAQPGALSLTPSTFTEAPEVGECTATVASPPLDSNSSTAVTPIENAPTPTELQAPGTPSQIQRVDERLDIERGAPNMISADLDLLPILATVAAQSETPEELSTGEPRRSGRAITARSVFDGIVKASPTEEDLDLTHASAPAVEREGGDAPSSGRSKRKPDTARKTSTKTEKMATSQKPRARASKASQNSATPKKSESTKAARGPRTPKGQKDGKTLGTPKAPAKAVVKLAITNGQMLVTLAANPPAGGPAAKPKRGAKRLPLTPPSSQVNQAETQALPEIDGELLSLSKALTHREPLGSKPDPQGQPLVWADSRQALCETVPYFKKPQGGCHANDHHVYAFLFDGVGHCREYMDSDLIIARAGGSMESDSSGTMLQGKDHSMNEAQVLAMLNDIKLQNPLIVICGDKNTGAPSKMPHKYCVLGWFKPISVWAEKTAGKGKKDWVTIKYRLERLNSAEPAWHAPAITNMPKTETAGLLMSKACTRCAKSSPQVYLISWMCLNPSCKAFWKLATGADAPSGMLDYNPAFLLERSSWDIEAEPFSVKPALPDVGKAIGDNLSYVNTRGICCPECGRCNHRHKFSGWICDNPECSWEGLPANHQPILPVSLHQPWDSVGDGPSLARNRHETGVEVAILYTHGYKVHRYTFAGIEGSFIHAVANNKINREHEGPDDMLASIQIQDMGLERRRFNSEKMSGNKVDKAPKTPDMPSVDQAQLLTPPREAQLMTEAADPSDDVDGQVEKQDVEVGDFMTAFSMNYGMPYKFVASGASKSFESAPWPVRACRSRLNWAQKTFLSDRTGDTDFNEELIFAYMEGQKIEYHDDGEEGLGPRIATLSLGGKAKMHLRLKAKHFVGCSKTGLLTIDDRPPVPGGFGGAEMDAKRRAAWDELQLIKDTDRKLYQKRLKEVPLELGIFKERTKKASDLVTVTLGHGDIILMGGYDIQKYLEHKVVPEGYLRFALTCRTVLENHLKPEERPQYEVMKDDYGYDGSNLL
ncbi:hypothetical protein LTR85_002381 [Meristemomyces frigidus]|nr:hypothetical protein LTR85_002381 [Meristemomyces frigidus]